MRSVVIGLYFVSKLRYLKTATRKSFFFFVLMSSISFCILCLFVSICALAVPICLDFIVVS